MLVCNLSNRMNKCPRKNLVLLGKLKYESIVKACISFMFLFSNLFANCLLFSLVAVGGIGSGGGGGPTAVVNSSVDILMPSLAGDLSSLSMNDKQPLMNNTVSTIARISLLKSDG